MKNRIASIIASSTIFLFCGCSLFQEAAWEDFSSEKGKFTVTMPGKPKLSKGFERTSNTSSINTYIYAVRPTQLFKKNPEYAVVYASMSNWDISKKLVWDHEKGMEGAKKGILNKTKGKLVEEFDIEVAGYPGRQIIVEVPDGWELESRYFYKYEDKRMYQLSVAYPSAEDYSEEKEQFFSSFRWNDSQAYDE